MKKIIEWHKNWCEKWRQAMKMSHYATYWVSFFKGAILVLLFLALVGCSGVPKTVTYQAKPIDRQDLILP